MSLKRLSNAELVEKCSEIFYDYMISHEDFYTSTEKGDLKVKPYSSEDNTPVEVLHQEYLDEIEENSARIRLYEQSIQRIKHNAELVNTLKFQLDLIKKEREVIQNSNIKNQKALYKRSKKNDYTRSIIRVPLNKKINSFYDDFILDVLFYDDVCVLNGKFEEYKKLKTSQEKKKFLKANTEITHLGLSLIRDEKYVAVIGIKGQLNFKERKIREKFITLLDSRFSDFDNLTLKDTSEIYNNDLRQLIQSKIDLDKENLKLLASKFIGNDEYKIFLNPNYDGGSLFNPDNKYYIRYVCPSTKRVYYNSLRLKNLALSDYFKENEPESYIDAWWNITHLGADPNGKAMIRC